MSAEQDDDRPYSYRLPPKDPEQLNEALIYAINQARQHVVNVLEAIRLAVWVVAALLLFILLK